MPKTNAVKSKLSQKVSIDPYQFIDHLFKTPISAIKGFLEALISEDCGRINSFQREYLLDALENTKRMSGFVDDFLDISRIEEKQFGLKLGPVALEKIIEQTLSELAIWIKASNSQVEFKKPRKLPKVLTDPEKISLVVQNLISNAVVYKRKRGEVKINLEQKGKKIIFSCRDNGIGIPKKDFKKVFSKFYRSGEATEIDPSGAGLRLFISKAIIELSGGKIWFSKNENNGMTFCFSLPIAKT